MQKDGAVVYSKAFDFDDSNVASIAAPRLMMDCWDDKIGLDSLIGEGKTKIKKLTYVSPPPQQLTCPEILLFFFLSF